MTEDELRNKMAYANVMQQFSLEFAPELVAFVRKSLAGQVPAGLEADSGVIGMLLFCVGYEKATQAYGLTSEEHRNQLRTLSMDGFNAVAEACTAVEMNNGYDLIIIGAVSALHTLLDPEHASG